MDLLAKIPCTLIPQGEVNLLVPNRAIAVIIKAVLRANDNGTGPSIIGETDWNGRTLKVFSANDKANETPLPDKSVTLVVIKSPVTQDYMGFFASQSPKSVHASQRSLSDDNSPTYINAYALRYIYIEGTAAIIPDLPRCFSQLNQQVS